MTELPKKIQCLGSKTPDIKNHNLIQIIPLSPNFICTLEDCSILYYNISEDKWYSKPGIKAKALQTSKD